MALTTRAFALASVFASLFTFMCLDAKTAGAAPVIFKCGAVVSDKEYYQFTLFQTTSTTPVAIDGAQVTVKVPSGAKRCVKLRFEAGMSCNSANAGEFCTLSVAGPNGAFLHPIGGVAYLAGEGQGGASSFEFARRLGPGTYTFKVMAETNSASTQLIMPNWHMTVETTK